MRLGVVVTNVNRIGYYQGDDDRTDNAQSKCSASQPCTKPDSMGQRWLKSCTFTADFVHDASTGFNTTWLDCDECVTSTAAERCYRGTDYGDSPPQKVVQLYRMKPAVIGISATKTTMETHLIKSVDSRMFRRETTLSAKRVPLMLVSVSGNKFLEILTRSGCTIGNRQSANTGCWVQIFDQSDLGLMPDRQASRIPGQSCVGVSGNKFLEILTRSGCTIGNRQSANTGCWVQIFDQSDLGLMPDRQSSRIPGQSCVGFSMNYFTFTSTNIVTDRLTKHIILDEAMVWFCTLGGGFSSLGDNCTGAAEVAGKISLMQMRLALEIGSPVIQAKAKLWFAQSLLQRGLLRASARLLRRSVVQIPSLCRNKSSTLSKPYQCILKTNGRCVIICESMKHKMTREETHVLHVIVLLEFPDYALASLVDTGQPVIDFKSGPAECQTDRSQIRDLRFYSWHSSLVQESNQKPWIETGRVHHTARCTKQYINGQQDWKKMAFTDAKNFHPNNPDRTMCSLFGTAQPQ
ncbi:hypothetical protein CLF_110168 [Clonorchis sinensis]|uniref:Uncharacterized protein n=1 Tax=Clonorchis sinensis TaxID=79923 RepID=G7YT78_CLOSI|nr:hypothetical protein CLF_110168 [Clonorchis sinensis]